MKSSILFVLFATLLLSACGAKEGIEVSDAWARTGMQGGNGAVYFVIQNHNADMDELIGAASNAADAVEIHESKMEEDVMTMMHMEAVALEPSQKVKFMPGGLHVMLIGLKQELKAGDEIEITLQFMNSADIALTVPVKAQDGMDMNSME